MSSNHYLSLERLFQIFVLSILVLIAIIAALGTYGYLANRSRIIENRETLREVRTLRIESRRQTCDEINKIRIHLRRTHLRRAGNSFRFLSRHPAGFDGITRRDVEDSIRTEIDEVDSFASIDCDYYSRHVGEPSRYLKVLLPVELLGYRQR